jgi:preprotein translocase subunit SecY
MLEAVFNAFKIPDLRRKLLFTLAMLVIFRIIASIRGQSAAERAQPLLRRGIE